MVMSVYLKKLVPVLYTAGSRDIIRSGDNFQTQVGKRLTRVVYMVNNRTEPVYWSAGRLVEQNGGVHVVVGLTGARDPYLLSVLNVSDKETGGVEIGVFSGDSGFVDEVRESMETELPSWIRAGDTDNLTLQIIEDLYAIASKRRKLV
ncbi:MAG: hypothetical protein HYT71_03025 [Candidatus Aenigmarchaeota archaeon]|nr:hypothetical protein [Candidatus Aenigmarchaeota archaeon]